MNKEKFGYKKACLTIALASALTSTVQAQIQFEDVTSTAGYFHVGESWGASWGDLNGDARPDLFVSNHRDRASVYRNNGDGTFTDVVLTVDQSNTWLDLPLGDTHGGTWTDFDADGDQDMIIATGTQIPPHLFVNENGVFTDQTTALGIPNDGGGRMSAVFDFNDDALIDFAIMNSGTSMILEQQAAGGFLKVNSSVGFDCNGFRSNYAQLTDLNDDIALGGDLEFFCMRDGTSPAKVFDTSTDPFTDITLTVPTAANVVDTVTGDFDRNLLPDIFMVRGSMRPGQVLEVSPQKIEASLVVSDVALEKEFYFQSTGSLDVDISTRSFGVFRVFIGSTGIHPSDLIFSLDAADPNTWGLMAHDPLVDHGIYIGYDTTLQEWRFQLASAGNNQNIYATVISDAPISGLTLEGLGAGETPIQPRLFMNTGGVLQDETIASGLNKLMSCIHAVAADLDNDMDEDLYLVCRGGVENIENRLFENQGDGTFVELVGAGGALGAVGVGLDSGAGTGESVTFGDYDMDGFLDLLVLNGLNLQPLHVGGPNQLFRNLGNSNHWIQLDLVGTASNVDAVGAKVYASASGITQMRERNGSYHRWSHDTQRVHFGMGTNTTVDLTVFWPNGDSDIFTNVSTDEIYKITQDPLAGGNGTIEPVVFGPVPGLPTAQAGDECGEPAYDANLDRVILIWKDCVNDSWHIQAMSGGSPTNLTYSGKITSDQDFTSVVGDGLEVSDSLDFTTDPKVIDFTFKMNTGGRDGVNFTFPGGSLVCFDPATLPVDAQVLVGSKHLPLQVMPMDLESLEACINLSIDDVQVSEGDGTASFTVSLSSASSSTVTVDYATVPGSATADVDYTSVSNTLTFNPGEISMPVDVSILQDLVGEGSEEFSILLTNPGNASFTDDTGVATIMDDDVNACGQPSYDPNAEKGVFLWKDCGGSEQWYMRTTGGGDPDKVTYEGLVKSNLGFSSVVPFSIEASDTLDNSTDPNQIDYIFGMKTNGQDGFDFTYPAGALTCFDATVMPAGSSVFLGSDKTAMTGPFNLDDFGPCLSLSIDDVEVSEADGTASFTVTLSAASTNTVTVDYVSVAGSATSDVDYVAVNDTLTFNPTETSKQIDVTINQDLEGEGTEDYTIVLSNPVNATIDDDIGEGMITDDDMNACGQPNYDPNAEKGVFLWKDCDGSEQWYMRTTGGGDPNKVSYEGIVTSNLGFNSLTPFSVEASDTLDNATDPNRIDYIFGMKTNGQDGFDFTYPAASLTCFDATLMPAGSNVFLGGDKTAMVGAFNLDDFGPCLGLSIDDVEVSEADGTASFTVTLSAVSSNTVTVDYATVAGTATADVDFTAVSDTLTFNPGETSKPIDISILQDLDGEGTEDYTIVLSNPVNSSLDDDIGEGTITDDDMNACGAPSYDPNAEKGVFLWKDCDGSEQWYMRTTGGGDPNKVSYEGVVKSNLGFSSLTPFSVEASDTLDNSTDPNRIDYIFGMKTNGQDGFDFTYPAGALACIDATLLPAGSNVFLGSEKTVMPDTFNLDTFGACLSLSIDDVNVSEGDGTASFTVTLSAASTSIVTVDYASVAGSATADVDYTSVSDTLTFNPTETSKQIDVTINQDLEGEGTEDYTIVLSSPTGASIDDDIGAGTIMDDDVNACGEPSYDPGSEKGVFVWQDCDGSQLWHMRTTGGGDSNKVSYEGNVTSNLGFSSLTPFSVEASDTLDNSTDPNRIDYVFGMRNTGQDGFDFTYPAGASTCFDATLIPSGANVFLGSDKTVMPDTFNLETFGSCLSLSIDDVSVSEGDGTASFTVTLSAISTNTVTVDYASVAGSATSDVDYTSVSDTLTFVAGETSKQIDVTIVQDLEGEGTEDYSIELSNASNASITDASGAGEIMDDDVNACGQPSFDKAVDQGVFVWKDCDGSELWHMRTTGGGSPTKITYEGMVDSSLGFSSLIPFSIEANDTLDNSTDPNRIDYILGMKNTGQDGFEFTFPAGSTTCFEATSIPAGAQVILGSDNTVMSAPFDLVTRGACL